MKSSRENNLRIIGALVILFAIFIDLYERTPPVSTLFTVITIASGFLLIILGTILIKRKANK
jgi:uncharacterized membrane protein